MYLGRWARSLANSLLVMLMASMPVSTCVAQGHDDHHGRPAAPDHRMTAEANALVRGVREATLPFKDVTSFAGPGGGYGLAFGCVSGGEYGAMGLHYVNMDLVQDGEVNMKDPEIVLYEPTGNGSIRITGADYLVYAADWEKRHDGPPMLMGQLFHYFESPNRLGLPAFYTLHVWAWKDNPNGTFVNWNPNVSCDGF